MNFLASYYGTRRQSLVKGWGIMSMLFLLGLFFAEKVQSQGCTGISFSFEHYDPCHFRARYNNSTDCFSEIRYSLASGTFSSWTVNMAAGFTVEVISASELWIHHVNGFLPLGDQVPITFILPTDLITTMGVAYIDDCAQLGCEIFGGIPIESCPDPKDANIIGVKYRECGSLPYTNQPLIPDWTIQLLDAMGNVIGEQVTDADGAYAFYDLPAGSFTVKEGFDPDWHPQFPASGQYAVDLSTSQQAVRNFGNCPGCSCDSIYMDVVQLPVNSDTCAYAMSATNTGAYCFEKFNISIPTGTITIVNPAAGWSFVQPDTQHVQLIPIANYIPTANFQPCVFSVTGSATQAITVSTSYVENGVPVTCTRNFSFQCPPPAAPPPCCPAGSTFGNELVLNGDFQSGNQDFTNSYTYFTPGGPTMIGKYSVLTQAQIFPANSQWACTDHSAAGGQMLIVDGYAGPIAWEQPVNVVAGKNYSFAAWLNNLVLPTKNYDDPQMALFVGNVQIAGPLNLPENPDQWVRLCGTWTATATGQATLSIRMLAITSIGNDVAIDDISFRECIPPAPCQVSINVTQNSDCTVTVCAVSSGQQPVAYQWCDGRTDACFTTQQTPCVATTYCVTATCSDGTTSSATIVYTVQDNTPPVAVCNLGIGVNLSANCNFLVTPAFVDGGSTDNCGIQSMSVNPSVLTGCGNTTVTLTVTDWCGNTSTCSMGIQTTENVPPIMTCPANTIILGSYGSNGLCTALFNPTPPVAIDNCDPSVAVTSNAPPVLQQGSNTVSWTATDECGNQTTCTQIVTVQCGCCIDSLTFSNLIAQGFTVTKNGCSVTVTAPQFDSCFLFTTPPILDGENVQQVITPANGSWTFNIPENGYHQICVTVFDQCTSLEMCSSVNIDCHPPVLDTSCCAYSMYFVNKYTDLLHIKKVRVSGICGTEICCADPDEWVQVDGMPNYIEWFEDNVNGVPNGDAIDNDFIIYLKKTGTTQNLEVEWFDAAGVVVCRHLLELDCDKPYNEDDDWTLNTSTTALDDPNLLVFAARAPEEDDESDCEEANEDRLTNSCDVFYTATCSGGTDYVVSLSGPSGFDKYFWEVIYAPIGVTYPTINSEQNPTFTAPMGGSYVISLVAVTASLDTCTNEGDIDIPIIDPDFDAVQLPCGYTVQFVAYGMDTASDDVSWSCPGYPSFPSSGNIITFDFQSAASVSVTMTIKDKYDCTHEITKQVDIVDCEAGVEVANYTFCANQCGSSGTTTVDVNFHNLSKGGNCPISYTWDYGDGIVSPPYQNAAAGETHQYLGIPCPVPVGGVDYTVTLTMDDGTCTSTATTTVNISPCDANFTYIACPDGRVDFYGDELGNWDFSGSIAIAKSPYSDKKQKKTGRQKHVRVRYDHSGIFPVKYKSHCANGAECTIIKEITVVVDCCTKNHHSKIKDYATISGKDYKLKGNFRSTQFVRHHKIVAKTRMRKRLFKIGGHTCWVISRDFAITAEFDGRIYGREKAHGCNCAFEEDIPASGPDHPIYGPWFVTKAKVERVWHKRKLHPRKDSITSTHTAEIDPVTLWQLKLQLGKDCVPFHWWTDWY